MMNYQEFQDFWWEYYHYLFLGVFLFINAIFILLLVCFNRKPEREKYFVQRSFHQDLLTWKSSITKMKLYYSKTSLISKVKFYVSRINFILLLAWLVVWLYTTGFYRIYLGYLTIIFGIYFGVEFGLYFLTIRQTIYPNFNNVSHNLTSLMIPFGGARLENKLPTLRKVIESACEIFEPKAIYLLHNGRDLSPKCYEQLRLITDEYEINYVYIPMPNKSYSIFYCAKFLCPDYSQCMIIDDDVILQHDFRIPELTDVAAMGYPISAYTDEHDNKWSKFLVGMQNIEYGLSGMVKIIQSRFNNQSSALSHHGAIGLWKKDVLVEVMSNHDAVFHGEDLMMGIIAYNLGYQMKFAEDTFVPTETPKQIFGPGGLFYQRVKSWDWIVLKYVTTYLKLLVRGSIFSNFMIKIYIINELWTIFIDFQRIPILIYALYTNYYMVGLFLAGIYVANIIMNTWFNYGTLRTYSQPSNFSSIIFFPVYKFLLVVFRTIGELRYLFLFESANQRMPVLIKNMPTLPNVLQETSLKLNEIDWERVWSDEDYMRYTMSLTQPIPEDVAKKIKAEIAIRKAKERRKQKRGTYDYAPSIESMVTSTRYNNNDHSHDQNLNQNQNQNQSNPSTINQHSITERSYEQPDQPPPKPPKNKNSFIYSFNNISNNNTSNTSNNNTSNNKFTNNTSNQNNTSNNTGGLLSSSDIVLIQEPNDQFPQMIRQYNLFTPNADPPSHHQQITLSNSPSSDSTHQILDQSQITNSHWNHQSIQLNQSNPPQSNSPTKHNSKLRFSTKRSESKSKSRSRSRSRKSPPRRKSSEENDIYQMMPIANLEESTDPYNDIPGCDRLPVVKGYTPLKQLTINPADMTTETETEPIGSFRSEPSTVKNETIIKIESIRYHRPKTSPRKVIDRSKDRPREKKIPPLSPRDPGESPRRVGAIRPKLIPMTTEESSDLSSLAQKILYQKATDKI